MTFSDVSDAAAASFSSSWRKKKSTAVCGVQCDEVLYKEEEIQTNIGHDKQIQTEDVQKESVVVTNEDTPQLATFLRKQLPLLEHILELNIKSGAFSDYEVLWEDEVCEIRNVVELSFDVPVHKDQVGKRIASCTEVSWNSTGSIVCCSMGNLDHSGWCGHAGYLCGWNLFRRGLSPKKPDYLGETSSCLLCVRFHPAHPTLVAGGTFNGEIVVFDLDKTGDPTLISSDINDEKTHREPVSRLEWIQSGRRHLQLLSVGGDGKVLMWELSKKMGKPLLTVIRMFGLVTKASGSIVIAGATSMAFSKEDPSRFIVGSEGGKIYKCSIGTSKQQQQMLEKEKEMEKKGGSGKSGITVGDLPKCITFSFEPHAGPVHDISFSPFHRNVFVTASSDSIVKLYNGLQAKSALSLVPTDAYLYCIAWSETKPTVFACGAGDGHVYLYDLNFSEIAPITSFRVDSASSPASVQSLAFNKNVKGYVAAGDSLGRLSVWQLSDFLITEGPDDKTVINRFGELKKKNKAKPPSSSSKNSKDEERTSPTDRPESRCGGRNLAKQSQ